MNTQSPRTKVRAFLIYGLVGGPFPYGLGYSLGLDALRDKLRARRVEATTHVEGVFVPHTNVGNLVRQAATATRTGSKLLLLGHSMGADAAVKIAERLANESISVDLLIGLDPTKFACPGIPKNVRRALCFYQQQPGDFLGRGRFSPTAEFSGECVNECVPYGHKVMDEAPALHLRVLAEADALLAKVGP
jgi:pimeloyl-ACP methyl ester carboxylesterase